MRELRRGLAEQPPHLGVLGRELAGADERPLRELPARGLGVGRAELVRELGVVGLLLHRAGKAVGGVGEEGERDEGLAEARVELRVLGEEGDRLLEGIGGGLVGARLLVELADEDEPLGPLRIERQRALVRLDGFVLLPELDAGLSERLVHVGDALRLEVVPGRVPDPHALHERVPRLLELARLVEGRAEVVEEVGIVGPELDGLAVPLRGVVLSPEAGHRPADARVEGGVLGEGAHRLLERERGLLVLLLGLVEVTELRVPFDELGVELEGLLVGDDRLLGLAERHARLGQTLLRLRGVGADADARLKRLARLLPALPPHLGDAELEAQLGVGGLELHRAFEDVGGLVERRLLRRRGRRRRRRRGLGRRGSDRLGQRGLRLGCRGLGELGLRGCRGGRWSRRCLRGLRRGVLGGLLLRGLLLRRRRAEERAAEDGQHLRLVGQGLQRGVEGVDRVDVLADGHEELPELHLALGEGRLVFHRRLVREDCLVVLLQRRAGLAEGLVGRGVLGPIMGRLLEVLSRLFMPLQEVEGDAQLIERLGVVGGEADGGGEGVDGLVEATEPAERVTELGVHAPVLGEIPQRGLVGLDRLLVHLQRLVLAGDRHVPLGEAGLELEGAAEGGDGVLVLLQRGRRLAEELVGLGDVLEELRRRIVGHLGELGLQEANGLAKRARPLLPFALSIERPPQRGVEEGVLLGELRRALVRARRLGPLLEPRIRRPRMLQRHEVVGLELRDLIPGLGGDLGAFELEGDLGELQLRVVVIGLELRRRLVGVAGVREVFHALVGRRQVEVRVEVLGLRLHRAEEGLDGVLGLSELLIRGAELKPLEGVIGIDEEGGLQKLEELLQILGHGAMPRISGGAARLNRRRGGSFRSRSPRSPGGAGRCRRRR